MWTCPHWHMGTGLNPFPPTGLLSTRLFTYKHMLCCRPRLPQALLYVGSLSMPQPRLLGVLNSCAHPGPLLAWQGAGRQLPARREPRQPACWGLSPACPSCNCCPSPPGPSHNSRSSRDTAVGLQDRPQMVAQLLLLIHRSAVNSQNPVKSHKWWAHRFTPLMH